MDKITIRSLIITPLKKIYHPKGDILHCMKDCDRGYSGFGEAYISKVKPDQIKGWNRHKKMTLNFIVPIGSIKFVIIDDNIKSFRKDNIAEVELSPQNYQRLTVPPGLWVGFQNTSKTDSLLLNIADIKHVPTEKESMPLSKIDYNWSII